MRTLFVLGLCSTLGILGACSDDDHGDGTTHNCSAEKNVDEFVVGLSKPGTASKLEFKLLSSDPAPPSRGNNTWVLQLDTMAAPAQPLTGAMMTVVPFMPAHEHGAQADVVVTPLPDAGQYKLDPVNMWMPGVWETTIDVKNPNGTTMDTVVFRFCLPS